MYIQMDSDIFMFDNMYILFSVYTYIYIHHLFSYGSILMLLFHLLSLLLLMVRFSEAEAARLLRPLLESVAYLHDLGIVHRDLKVLHAPALKHWYMYDFAYICDVCVFSLSLSLSTCPSVCLSVCLYVCMYVCLLCVWVAGEHIVWRGARWPQDCRLRSEQDGAAQRENGCRMWYPVLRRTRGTFTYMCN